MFNNKFKFDSITKVIENIISEDEKETKEKHEDEVEDKALVKKMVKGSCLKKESWDDDEDDDVRRADAELKRMKAKPIEADKKTDPDKEIGKLAKKTPKEVDESVEQIDELSISTMGNYMQKSIAQKLSGKKDRTPGMQKAYKKMTTKKVSEDKWTDVADGPWKKSKRTPDQAASADANAAGKGLKGAQHKLDVAEPKGKLTAADFKKLRKEESELCEKTLTPAESKKKEEIVKSMKKGAKGFKERYGKRAKEVMYATATKQAKRVAEEAEQIDELSKKTLQSYIAKKADQIPTKPANKKDLNNLSLAMNKFGRVKRNVSEAKGPTSDYGLETNTVESPALCRAKELAHTAMKRVKNEMLGKAGCTSEEIDTSVKSTDTLKGRMQGGKSDDVGPGADGKSTKVKFTPGPK